MSETLTMNETPADQPEFNADEQDSLAVAESLGGEQPLLAGKFKDQQSLEKAYLELQQKLGEPRDEVQATEDEGEPAEQEPAEEDNEVEEESSQEVLTQAQADALFEMVGGKAAYKSMIDWAGQNLSPEEVAMYDSVMDKGDPNSVFFAVQALFNEYSNQVGEEGQLLTGRTAPNSSNGFRSQQELVQAMADPRYDRDPAYRQEVMQKLENSDVQF
jgi:hypothetical protein